MSIALNGDGIISGVSSITVGAGASVFSPAANTLAFGTNDSERVRIDSSGNIGIGTNSPADGSRLHIQGGGGLLVRRSAGTSIARFGNTGSVSPNITLFGSSTVNEPYIGCSTDDLIFGTSNAERARIDSSGRFLVGTTSYAGNGKLITAGNTGGNAGTFDICWAGSRPTAADTDIGYIRWYSADNSSSNYHYASIHASSDGTSSSGTDIPGRLVFSVTADGAASPTERMRLNSTGRLLIGTVTDPGYQLSVVGQNSYAFGARQDVGNWTYPVGTFHSNFTSGDNKFIEFYTDASSLRGGIDYNRAAGQVRYNITSDRRLKSDIQPASTALNALSNIQVRSYKWTETNYHIDYGFIAQELNEVVPDAVKVGDDGEEVTDTWGVDNAKLVPLLTKALQEAMERVETLEAENETLKNDFTTLATRVAALESA